MTIHSFGTGGCREFRNHRSNCGRAAAAWIRGDSVHPCLRGKVTFLPRPGGTLVIADIRGLPDSEAGFFALHIHQGRDCAGAGLSNTGSHFDPDETAHPMHAGDLPPLLNCGGNAYLAVLTNRFRIEDILGRTVVIHSHPDDFKTQPAGGAGSKIACGVIRQI